MDPHCYGSPDPHRVKQLDPDPHWNQCGPGYYRLTSSCGWTVWCMLSMLVTGTTTLSSPWLITCTPVSVDVNGFYPRKRAWCCTPANSTCRTGPVIHIFLLPPVLFVEQTQTPLYLETGLSPLFSVHNRFSPPDNISSYYSTPQYSTYFNLPCISKGFHKREQKDKHNFFTSIFFPQFFYLNVELERY